MQPITEPSSPRFRIWVTALPIAAAATLVGFGGTVALVVKAGQALGAAPPQITSAVTALCIGVSLVGAFLSVTRRMPIVLAWSTPGAALVAGAGSHYTYPVALGAFAAASVFMAIAALIPVLARSLARIPVSIAAGLLAGVLLPFVLGCVNVVPIDPALSLSALGVYLLGTRFRPRYALVGVLATALAFVVFRGQLSHMPQGPIFGGLTITRPRLELTAVLGLGVPLFLVTLVSQNIPGLAVLTTAGYQPPAKTAVAATGAASLVLAPFGAHAVNLAAIVASICVSDSTLVDRERRWVIGLCYAGFYGLLALFSAPVVSVFLALPPSTVAVIAGLALLSPLSGALSTMLTSAGHRDAGVLTFVTAASGISLFGLGAPVWALAAGFLCVAAYRVAPSKSS